jgi:hypothetical protein
MVSAGMPAPVMAAGSRSGGSQVMPYSPASPRRENDVANLAPRAANRMSHISAWTSPSPVQAPLTAATSGLRRRR